MNQPRALEHLPWRLAGMVLLGVLVVLYEPAATALTHRLLIPIGMAVSAWLLVQNLPAVALGGGILAALHSAPGSSDWVVSAAYPALAGVCAVMLAAVLIRRFRRRIAATHDARWQHRPGRLHPPHQEEES